MTNVQASVRNTLVVGGGYFLSTLLVMPLWPFVSSWMNRGGHAIWVSTLVGLLPSVIALSLGGGAVGLALVTKRRIKTRVKENLL